MNDTFFMRQALDLARKGRGKVEPNPMVGCVIVQNGKVVGKGYHQYFGGPHAEVNALAEAGKRAKGATLYVTLEPCDHWGKTPPCTEAIIKAGIRKVVAAMSDPNPRIAGKGFKRLKKHHIKTVSGVLERDAAELNKQYLKFIKNRKSHVIVKAAMTLDGKIAASTGDSKWITSPKARDFVHRLRASVDGILVGINTVLADDCELTSHGKGKNPVRIVVDPGLKIPLSSRVLDGQAPTLLLYSRAVSKNKLLLLRQKGAIPLRVLKMNEQKNFKYIIKELEKVSIYKVLIEGGGETIANAITSAVVNEVFFFVSPKIIGGRLAKSPVEGTGIPLMKNAIPVENMSIKKIGPDLLIHGIL